MSILRELYHGNIRPDSLKYQPDSPFSQAAKVKRDSLEKLLATLTVEQNELFEAYCEAQSDIEDIMKFDTFSYGLRFGVMLMAAVFVGDGEDEES